MKPIKLAIVVSDIHCGSDVGLAPPEITTKAGNYVCHGKNLVQQWLWGMWAEGCERVAQIVGKDPAALVVNGDATEGVHHRNEASTITASIETHTEIAEACLSPLSGLAKKTYIVKGTECHTLGMEDRLAERLGAVSGKARDKWLFEINGCLIDAAHHTSTTSRAYLEASAMSIHLGNARVNYARCGHRIPRVFLRGHRHCGGYYSDGQGMYVITGAWQALTRHGYKVVTDSIPRPTMVVLDWRGKPNDSLPTVHEIVFTPPPNEIEIA
jgi:hypothetical protein